MQAKLRYFHVWFSPKRRKWLLQGHVKDEALRSIRETGVSHQYQLIAIEAMPDHIHLLIGLPPDASLSTCIRDLKGLSARAIFKAFPELKLDAEINNF